MEISVYIPDEIAPKLLEAANFIWPETLGMNAEDIGSFLTAEYIKRIIMDMETRKIENETRERVESAAAAERAAAEEKIAQLQEEISGIERRDPPGRAG